VIQRRDKHASDRLRSLQRKLRNLRSELLRQAGARRQSAGRAYDRGLQAGVRVAVVKTRQIDETLSLMAQQQAWYRDRFRYIAGLLRSDDWRERARGDLDSYLNGVAWLAEDARRQPMFPVADPIAVATAPLAPAATGADGGGA
jgi:hypothetical protein